MSGFNPSALRALTRSATSSSTPAKSGPVGWLAQWEEMLEDKEQKIARPRQVYVGEDARDFVSVEDRG